MRRIDENRTSVFLPLCHNEIQTFVFLFSSFFVFLFFSSGPAAATLASPSPEPKDETK